MAPQTWGQEARDHGHTVIPVAIIEITSAVVTAEPCFIKFFNVGNCSNVVTLKNNILPSLDFQNVQNIRIENETGHESHVDRNHEFYAPVACCGLRIFQYLGRTMDTCKTTKKLIYMLACMLVVSAGSVPFATARDPNRDSLQNKLMQEQLQQLKMGDGD
jgi:hypothetical protein